MDVTATLRTFTKYGNGSQQSKSHMEIRATVSSMFYSQCCCNTHAVQCLLHQQSPWRSGAARSSVVAVEELKNPTYIRPQKKWMHNHSKQSYFSIQKKRFTTLLLFTHTGCTADKLKHKSRESLRLWVNSTGLVAKIHHNSET